MGPVSETRHTSKPDLMTPRPECDRNPTFTLLRPRQRWRTAPSNRDRHSRGSTCRPIGHRYEHDEQLLKALDARRTAGNFPELCLVRTAPCCAAATLRG